MPYLMLETRTGTPDGVNRQEYEEGEVYDLPPVLSRTWLDVGACKEVPEGYDPDEEDETSGPAETKPIGPGETKPDGPDEQQSAPEHDPGEVSTDSVTFKPTKHGSPYYQFFDPDGNMITDPNGDPIKVRGREAAQEMKEEIESGLKADGLL